MTLEGNLNLSTTPTKRRATRENTLSRSIEILDFLHRNQEPTAPAQLARHLGAPRSTIYKLVNDLVQAGLLEPAGEPGQIYFGKSLYLYGLDYLRHNDLVRRGSAEVDRLSQETGETAELCMLHNGRYTVVHTRVGTRPFRISTAIGQQIPLPWTASARLLLSDMTREEIEQFITPEDLVLPDGRRIDMDDFLESIVEARRVGYSMVAGLVDAFANCIAAPIFSPTNRVDATLCLVIPRDVPQKRLEELVALLVERAKKLSR